VARREVPGVLSVLSVTRAPPCGAQRGGGSPNRSRNASSQTGNVGSMLPKNSPQHQGTSADYNASSQTAKL